MQISNIVFCEILSEGISQIKRNFINHLKNKIPLIDIKKIKRLLSKLHIMPTQKVIHSMNVAKNVTKYSDDVDIIMSALFHDYIERGGDIDRIDISETSKDIIKMLSILDNENETSEFIDVEMHMNEILSGIENQELRNDIIHIKLSDRLDNIRKRAVKKSLSKDYLNKSIDLFKTMDEYYNGKFNIQKIIKSIQKEYKPNK